MMNNKVSIILPTHNGEKFIGESIDSCLAQTYSNFELIIIDDASTDGTSAVINEYARGDSRIRLLHNDTNLKLPRTLNKGFESSTGEYLTWTSDDNRYALKAIEHMVSYLDEHPDTDFVYSNFYYIDEKGNITGKTSLPGPRMHRIGPCFMYRRKIYATIGGYNPDVFLVEDYEYWLRVYDKFKMRRLNKYLYYHRLHKDSLSSSSQQEITRLMEQARDRLVRSKSFLNFLKADKAIKQNDYSEARKYFLKSFFQNPFNLPLLRIGIILLTGPKLTERIRDIKDVLKVFLRFRGISKYLLMMIGKLAAHIASVKFDGRTLFFFPTFHIGGADIVHLRIFSALRSSEKVCFFTNRSFNKALKSDFDSCGKSYDIHALTVGPIRYLMLGYLTTCINRSCDVKIFCGSSSFCYQLIPYINSRARIYDLIHAIKTEPEKLCIPVTNVIARRFVVVERVKNELLKRYAASGIPADEYGSQDTGCNKLRRRPRDFCKKQYHVN